MAYRVLLADDSITIQKVVEIILSGVEGIEIESVADGVEALDSLTQKGADVVLADIDMPRMNGYTLCERIRQTPELASIPVILIAGAFEPFDEARCRDVGAEDYLIKPFDSQDLIGKIEALRSRGGQEAVAEPPFEKPEVAEAPTEEAPAFSLTFESVGEPETPEAMPLAGELDTAAEAEALPADGNAGIPGSEAPPSFGGLPASVLAEAVMETGSEEGVEEAILPVDQSPAEPPPSPEPSHVLQPPLAAFTDEEVVISGEDFGDEDFWEEGRQAATGIRPPLVSKADLKPSEPPARIIPIPPLPTPEAQPAAAAAPSLSPEEIRSALASALENLLPSRDEIDAMIRNRLESLLPGRAEVRQMVEATIQSTVTGSVQAALSEAMDAQAIRSAITGQLDGMAPTIQSTIENLTGAEIVPFIKESVDRVLRSSMPEISERVIRETVTTTLENTLGNQIEDISKSIIAGVAEGFTARLIDRLKS